MTNYRFFHKIYLIWDKDPELGGKIFDSMDRTLLSKFLFWAASAHESGQIERGNEVESWITANIAANPGEAI